MERREEEATKEIASKDLPASPPPEPPLAYIPACGTLCDAFWWARRSTDREKSD